MEEFDFTDKNDKVWYQEDLDKATIDELNDLALEVEKGILAMEKQLKDKRFKNKDRIQSALKIYQIFLKRKLDPAIEKKRREM